MRSVRTDVAILGSGFGGSLTAMALARIGLRPVLIERGTHPRFAIGESTTPIANLVLADLADRYDLPRIRPLARYGAWRKTYPQLPCGLKRGFCYFHHRENEEFTPAPDHRNELFVEANSDEEDGDTHWLRSALDEFLLVEARAMGVEYLDRADVQSVRPGATWRFKGRRGDEAFDIESDFAIDAAGSGGVFAKALGLGCGANGLRTNTRAIYTHFEGVGPWASIYAARGGRSEDHPFSCDRATLHHVFDGGWLWVIPFDNGVTSAGFVLNRDRFPSGHGLTPEAEWCALCGRLPSVAEQLEQARPLQSLVRTDRLQRRWERMAGDNWAMLPHAAYFLDPLHSAGNAHTLLGMRRLVALLERHPKASDRAAHLRGYETLLRREIDLLDLILDGGYAAMADFDLFTTFTMAYFVGATGLEQRLRSGGSDHSAGYLLADVPEFRAAAERGHRAVLRLAHDPAPSSTDVRDFATDFARALGPFNAAGLCDPRKCNMYPFV